MISNNMSEELFGKLQTKLRLLKSQCKICSGKGVLLNQEEGFFKDCPGCTQKIEKYEKCFLAKIPEDLMEITLLDLKATLVPRCYDNLSEIISKIEKVVATYQMVIYTGDNQYSFGSMTVLGLLLKELASKNYEAMHIHFTEAYENCFTFGNGDEVNAQRAKVIEKIKSVPILGISDFAADEKKFTCNEFAYKKLSEILNIRRLNGLFTLIAMERSKSEFAAKYPGSILTMFNQYYLPFIVQCHDGKHKHQAITKLAKEDESLANAFSEPDSSSKVIVGTNKSVIPEEKESDDVLDRAIGGRSNGKFKKN